MGKGGPVASCTRASFRGFFRSWAMVNWIAGRDGGVLSERQDNVMEYFNVG